MGHTLRKQRRNGQGLYTFSGPAHGPGVASRVSVTSTHTHASSPDRAGEPEQAGCQDTGDVMHVTGVMWPIATTTTAWTLTHDEPRRHPRRAPMPSLRPTAQATWGCPAPQAHALRLPQCAPPAVSSTDPCDPMHGLPPQHAHVLTVRGRVGHEGEDTCGVGCDGGGRRPWGTWDTLAACKYC